MKAVWNETVLAESDDIVEVEGNYYFPMKSIKKELFKESDSTSLCVWKGKAKYLTVFVNGKENRDCAWYYPVPSFLAKKIKDRIAFWNGVQVIP
ncbi:MAG: DUF427 domain-containing protein [Thaumarchaeota archaeon]|nr:DUF427 domain-containing protein [Nitrososphaerota archaeon]